jgi:hypothetical protein
VTNTNLKGRSVDSTLQLIANEPFRLGARVLCRRSITREGTGHGGWQGTIIGLPPELAGGQDGVRGGLYAVLADHGTLYGLAPDVLELCSEAVDGLQIAAQVLHEKREDLFHDMLCTVAASRRADVRDPRTRMQIEAEVRRMSASWGDADSEKLRRKEFSKNPELRKRLIGSLTKYLELGDLLHQVAELMGAES